MNGDDNQRTLDGDSLSAPSPIPHPPSPGLPARYEILRELGSGGMGIVYQARDKETAELVALKVLRPEIAADAAALERFKNELRLARKITHKNVCRIHEFHSATVGACISMEYVEGQSLRAMLSRVEGLSVHHGMKILQQVLSGMAEAHAQGVVHRDLKPENILVTAAGTAKVMDFGIAVTGEGGATVQGITGTPAYMSPEQAEGKAADARSDIYSLGLVMFELFTGHTAMSGETPLAVVHKQIHEIPHPPRDYEPDLPDRIDLAIQRCLEKDAKRRFQSVAELEAALEKNAPLPASEEQADPEPPEHLGRWAKIGDSVLVILALAAMAYFVRTRDLVFPTSSLRLEVDTVSARRAAEDAAKRLGIPIGEAASLEANLDLRGWLRKPAGEPGQPVSWRAEPLVFRVRRSNSDRSATVNRKGSVESLEAPTWVPPFGVTPPLEVRRRIAQQTAEALCGPITAGLRLEEGAGGEKKASYIAEWSRTLMPQIRVSLRSDKPIEVNCSVQAENAVDFIGFFVMRWMVGSGMALILVAAFLIGRCYRLAARWKRFGLAAGLGAVMAWMASPMIATSKDWDIADLITKGRVPPAILLLLAATGFTVLLWVGLVTAEYKLRRFAPQWIASYVQLWRGRVMQPAVLLALVRGGAFGMLLLAFETALAHASLQGLLPLALDHDALAQAIRSGWPAGFAVSVAIFDGVVAGGILLALATAANATQLQSPQGWRRWLHGLIAVPFWWFLSAQHLHLTEFMVTSGARLLYFLGVFFLEAVFLAWVLRRYDILTVMATVFTFTLWTINWPLLGVFETVGNGAHQAIQAGWFAMMLGAAAMAFRSHLTRGWKQVRAAQE